MTPDEALKGTFLAKVTETLTSGNLIEPEQEADPYGTVIGEMTPLEKAVYTAMRLVTKEIEAKLPACNCNAACLEACSCQSAPPKPELAQELATANMSAEALNNILAALTQARLNWINSDSAGIGFCKGFKIVAFSPELDSVFMPMSDGKIHSA